MTERATARLRVLLVEDDTDLRDAVCDALADAGYDVMTAVDGDDGLRQLREARPDVVVLDLMMPKLDGWQFRVAQRNDPMLAAIPVVAISASGSATAAAIDADVFLRKPLDATLLRRALEEVVAAHARRQDPTKVAETDRLATLGTLAAGLAHEINNPLTYLLLHLSQAVRLLPELATSENREMLAKIQELASGALEGAERIRDIMSGIRTFSRVDAATMKPLDVRVPIDAALRLVANELRHRARLVKQFEDPPTVNGNEGRLGQVFLNLFSNALHALPEGAAHEHELRVSARADDAGDLVVEVADTGTGIPPHALPHLFEPYFSTKPIGQGTGLGLSISRNIIASHGGTIAVSSELGRGSTFRIVLPARRRQVSA
jgi:signal transduction histidine kinase